MNQIISKSLLLSLFFFSISLLSLLSFPQVAYASDLTFGEDSSGLFIKNKTTGLELLKIINNGYLGIGTTTPSELLYAKSTTGRAALGLYTTAASQDAGLALATATSTTSTYWNIYVDESDSQKLMIGDADTALMGADITITKGGNVGIGTTKPTAKLDVSGDIKTSGNIVANDNKWGACTWRSKNSCDAQLLCNNGEYVAGIKTCSGACGTVCSLYCCKL